MRKNLLFLVVIGMVLLVGSCRCNKRTGTEPPEGEVSTGLFDTEAAERAAQGARSTTEAAPTAAARARSMEMPAALEGGKEVLLKREGYYVSYNKERRVPNWVAWRLTADHTSGKHHRGEQMFAEDMEVPSPRATDSDYSGSGYDRGHLCPSGDNKWSAKAQTESFLFTNVCPQNHELNKGDWNDLEQQCRYWAKRQGTLYIVAGPVFYKGVRKTKTIGRNKVAVPDAFFKVLLADGRKAKAIGFVYPNKGEQNDMTHYVKSVDEIERITGFDFFPMLDDRVENQVEAAGYQTMVDEWQVQKAVDYYNNRR